MKKIVLLFLFFLYNEHSFAQMSITSMGLEGILSNKLNIVNFIKSDLTSFKSDSEDLVNHSINIYKFNFIQKNPSKKYFLTDKEVSEIYAYLKSDDEFCLYIIMEMEKKDTIEQLIRLFGKPWNVSISECDSGDFDMLLWDKQDLNISLVKHFDFKKRDLKLLKVTNLSANELLFKR